MILKLVLVLIISGLFAISYTQYANSEFLSDLTYQLQGTGFTITDKFIGNSKLDLQLLTGKDGSRITITPKDGIISISGNNYAFSENSKVTISQDGKLLRLFAEATSLDGEKISLSLFGNLVESSKNGSVYGFTGAIDKNNQTIKAIYTVKIIKFNPTSETVTEKKETQPTQSTVTETKELKNGAHKIVLIATQYDPVQISYVYKITAKVYEADKNPTSNFNQNYGFVAGAKIIAQIIKSDGRVVKSFEGITSNNGYYSDGFRIPDNFFPGTYKVVVTAEKNGSSDRKEFVLHVQQYYTPK